MILSSKQKINHNIPGLINILGINSPGLTCSLAIGKYIAQKNLVVQNLLKGLR